MWKIIKQNLTYYWQTNLVVVFGVGAAVAVLAGALVVGDSVRESLRAIVEQRLGKTDHVIAATGYFREQLAEDVQPAGFLAVCPLIAIRGNATNDANRRYAGDLAVYGVDERFWRFHAQPEVDQSADDSQVLVSAKLATDLGIQPGDSILLRVEKHSAIPVESLHGRKDQLASVLRLRVRATLSSSQLGEFSLQPRQGDVRAVFVPLKILQRELSQEGRVNTLLFAKAKGEQQSVASDTALLERLLQEKATLEDAGLKLKVLDQQRALSLESESKVLTDAIAGKAIATASQQSLKPLPVLSYLANLITSGDRSIPYSLVTAIGSEQFRELGSGQSASSPPADSTAPPIILNEWAARDLSVQPGASISLEYYYWNADGRLETRTAQFRLAAITPIAGLGADRDLVPDYPGITESQNLSDWDPPFPIELGRVRKQDEDYWHQFRTTPKAFVRLEEGQKLWRTRFGELTSVRFVSTNTDLRAGADSFARALRTSLTPAEMGFRVIPVRQQGVTASQGATDFGAYFLYFSFFLVVSALLLTALFFRLGVEQRLREVGLLQAVGFTWAKVRTVFLAEAATLAILGSLLGLIGAVAYGRLMMFGLGTWWRDAVGTNSLSLHVTWLSLLIGLSGGVVAALLCVVVILRKLAKVSTRSLLSGQIPGESMSPGLPNKRRFFSADRLALILTIVGVAVLLGAAFHLIGQVAGFFGAGVTLLVAALCYQSSWLRKARRRPIQGTGWWSIWRLGFRNATNRPARSVLCIALIASATFIIVAVDAFRRDVPAPVAKNTGTGGFALVGESLLPIVHDLNSPEGREALNLSNGTDANSLERVNFARFRLRPGDDTSCLNLYQPQNPKIIAPSDRFINDQRFSFQSSLASTPEEQANPWLLLKRKFSDGAIPVIADANSLAYVLHRKVGEDLRLGASDIVLRVVAGLSDSIFQSELLISDENFVRLFPEQQGYRFFLVETVSPDDAHNVATLLEDRLSDYGLDLLGTGERLASFHRVENTYLSTFQMLGGLGLILGTFGMAAVLLRNVFERRRELALLGAIGYNSSHFTLMVLAENALLVGSGLVTGVACSLLAIMPALSERGGSLVSTSLVILLAAVLLSGLTASLIATIAVLRAPLLPALRAE